VQLKAKLARLTKDMAAADTFQHEAKVGWACTFWAYAALKPLGPQVLRAKNKALFEEIRTLKQEKLAVKQELAQMQEQAVRPVSLQTSHKPMPLLIGSPVSSLSFLSVELRLSLLLPLACV